MKNILFYFVKKHKGLWESVYNSISSKEYISKEQYNILKKKTPKNYISLIDHDYPEQLKTIYKPPFSIFYYGNNQLLKDTKIGIYGTHLKKKQENEIIKNKQYVYVIDFNNLNLIKFFIKNNIKFICVKNNGCFTKEEIFIKNKIISTNNLIISEMPTNNTKSFENQQCERIIYGLTKNILFLNDESDTKKFNEIINLSKNENIDCFCITKFDNNFINYFENIKTFMNYKTVN